MSDASIQCFDPAGRMSFDYRDVGAIFMQTVTVPAGSGTYSQQIPAATGRIAVPFAPGFFPNSTGQTPVIGVSYPGGVPQLNAQMMTGVSYMVYVFAR